MTFDEKEYITITANSSKSIMQRTIALAFLSDSSSKIFNPDFSEDSQNALMLIENLGCKVNKSIESIEIIPKTEFSFPELLNVNCGESGLLMRMFTAILSIFPNSFIIDGSGTLKNRILFDIEDILKKLGAKVKSNNYLLPLELHGPIKSGNIKLDASKTSQFLSGLIIALPKLSESSTIHIKNLVSKPYIDLTIDSVRKFGGKIDFENDVMKLYPSVYKGQEVIIEGDWSNAAVFLIAGAIAGEVNVTGLNIYSLQGDKKILEVIEQVGAKIQYNSEGSVESKTEHSQTTFFQKRELVAVKVKKHELKAFDFDAKDTPDLVPYLSVLAANCDGKSAIHNVSRINFKESKRLELIIKNLSQLKIKCSIINDTLEIWGGELQGGIFETGNDHRLAMAGALASLTSDEKIVIDDTDCVKKSYPNFWEEFSKLID
ncbi:MAG: 3-phosphoshikimate 1-carboxyvinyltransferase [Ignavibacteria bacterium GWF2_33_9]|nr:MAG: 3-phosphoshikimate 1-carboxyvinyltransferase [Ignavibacteria bacterium GWF2_33_9]